ncbi:hypothetical protein CgunFtcFv8_008057 [Champsocephalus gunnari]|uniref:Uncharacterized protein n=1 Tax=Champsocephalus gunnari TaxID=52237 RepID=A0AAN8HES5_CHAGU|nr:hypothetical protein CgunFtcFv8_008057 [Champsocephalus gunnari]
MQCQSREKPGCTSVITIVWIYTTSALFENFQAGGRQETLAARHRCTGRQPPSLMMQETLPLLLPRQTQAEEKGPELKSPMG